MATCVPKGCYYALMRRERVEGTGDARHHRIYNNENFGLSEEEVVEEKVQMDNYRKVNSLIDKY